MTLLERIEALEIIVENITETSQHGILIIPESLKDRKRIERYLELSEEDWEFNIESGNFEIYYSNRSEIKNKKIEFYSSLNKDGIDCEVEEF